MLACGAPSLSLLGDQGRRLLLVSVDVKSYSVWVLLGMAVEMGSTRCGSILDVLIAAYSLSLSYLLPSLLLMLTMV